MDSFWEFLGHFGLALTGLLIYSLIAIKDNLWRFKLGLFIHDNRPFWIWALLLQAIFAILIVLYPESAAAIKTLSGLDLGEPMAFLSSGAVLAKMANWVAGRKKEENKIGVRADDTTNPTKPGGPKT